MDINLLLLGLITNYLTTVFLLLYVINILAFCFANTLVLLLWSEIGFLNDDDNLRMFFFVYFWKQWLLLCAGIIFNGEKFKKVHIPYVESFWLFEYLI